MGSLLDYLVEHPNLISPDFEIPIWASQVANGRFYYFAVFLISKIAFLYFIIFHQLANHAIVER